MGKMNHPEIVAALVAENPKAKLGDMHLYAEAFLQWQEATANVREHGAIVAHPRTGSPIENPYLAVQSAALRNLQRFPKLKTDSLWRQEGEARP